MFTRSFMQVELPGWRVITICWLVLLLASLAMASMPQQSVTRADTLYAQAIAAQNEKTPASNQRAVALFEEAGQLYRSAGDRPSVVNCWLGAALSADRLRNRVLAIEYQERALPLIHEDKQTNLEIGVLRNIGMGWSLLDDQLKALAYYQRALVLARQLRDKRTEADLLNAIGLTELEIGDIQQAEKSLQSSRILNQSLPQQPKTRANELFAQAKLSQKRNTLEANQRAIAFFEEASKLYLAAGDKLHASDCWMGASLSASRLADFALSIEYDERALPVIREGKQKDIEMSVLKNIGSGWSGLGNRTKALNYYRQGLMLAREVGDKISEAELLGLIGSQQIAQEDVQSGIKSFQEELVVAKSSGNARGEATALTHLGGVAELLGKRNDAFEYYRAALPLRRTVQDPLGLGDTLFALGNVAFFVGQKQEGMANLQQALEVYEKNNLPYGQATTLRKIGELWLSQGQVSQALGYFRQALPIYQKINHLDGHGQTWNIIAHALTELGEYKEALDAYEKAAPLFERAYDRRGAANSLMGIGRISSLLGNKPEAFKFFQRALKVFEETQDVNGQAAAHGNSGLVLTDLGRYEQALVALRITRQLLQSVRDTDGEANVVNNIGLVHFKQKQFPQALDHYAQSLILYQAMADENGVMSALSNIAFTFHENGQPVTAKAFGKWSLNVLQQLRSAQSALDNEKQRGYMRRYEDLYSLTTDWLFVAGRLAEAQQAMHLARDQGAYDQGVKPQILSLTPAEQSLRERVLIAVERAAVPVNQLIQERSRLGTSAPTAAEQARLQQIENTLRDELTSLQRLFSQLPAMLAAAPAAQHQLSDGTAELTKTQRLLTALEQRTGIRPAVVYVLMTQEHCRTMLITANQVKAYAAPIKFDDLNDAAHTFLDRLQTPSFDQFGPGKQLYDVIVKPMADDLDKSGIKLLMWSLDRSLRYVPMAALWDGQRYLAERYQHVVLTRPASERLLDDVQRNWQAAGFGMSKAAPGFNALPGVTGELAQLFGDPTRKRKGVLTGKAWQDAAFTRTSFLTALKQRQPLVHIASHFRFQPGDETNSFLLMGNGEHFTLAEMKAMPDLFEGVELLTLSACNTATQKADDRFGREIEGFAELAQRWKAKAVMASLWAVTDASTSELMTGFYANRQSGTGMTKAAALQKAQLDLMQGRNVTVTTLAQRKQRTSVVNGETGVDKNAPPFTPDAKHPVHPHYWAPFVLIGNWQ